MASDAQFIIKSSGADFFLTLQLECFIFINKQKIETPNIMSAVF